jgi:hypothetical protein
MLKPRLIAVILILLSSGFSLLTGILLDRGSHASTANYRAIYYGARCVINRSDPYQPADFLKVYAQESGEFPPSPVKKQLFLRAVPICVNLPTTLFLVAPLALLPWSISQGVWLALIAISYTLAAFLVYDLASEYAPRLSLFLICVMLANSQVLFTVGNTAGIAVSFCIIATWCFIRRRSIWIGTLLFALSLALKPHDAGLLWALLLISGGELRKRAIWTLVIVIGLLVPSIAWISTVSPHWNEELKANLSTTSQRGDISDPGPTSTSRQGSADVIISLQTVLSVLRDDPGFYNPASILICAAIFAIILFTTIRGRPGVQDMGFAIAAVAALSMLPSYHRPYDAKLLLLAVPAAAMLWRNGRKGIPLVTVAAVVLTSDVPLAILSMITKNIHISEMSFLPRLMVLPLIRPAPLILLTLTVLYGIAYARNLRSQSLIHFAPAKSTVHG